LVAESENQLLGPLSSLYRNEFAIQAQMSAHGLQT